MSRELGAFDYQSLTANEAQAVRSDAEWVRSTYRTLQATTLETVIEIGQRLNRVRETIGHGKFLPWLASEFEFSRSTAVRMMHAADHFAGEQMSHVQHLPHKVVYALSSPSTPEPVRVYVKERAAAGEPPAAQDIERRISEAKETAKTASRPERKARDELRRRRETKAEEKRLAEQEAQSAREKKEAEEAFQMVADALGGDLRRFSALIAGSNLYRFGQMIQQAARESAA